MSHSEFFEAIYKAIPFIYLAFVVRCSLFVVLD